MRLVDQLYDWLSQGPTPDCDRIFAAALPHAEPAWAERIVRILLRRRHESSWGALIGRYSQLSLKTQAQVLEPRERFQAGVALALKSSSPEVRANALLALQELPCPRVAYLLPQALRDPTPDVRARASQVLRKMVDAFLERPPPPPKVDHLQQEHQAERRQLLLALAEALRAYDQHSRIEVLEACLWFARDLGEELWQRLTTPRSRPSVVVSEQLSAWNHPRLAHFLVSALRHPAWRGRAASILRTWSALPELCALLRQDDLLDDPGIRENLVSVCSPRWFTRTDDHLKQLDPDLRPRAPRWACHAGYRESEKMTLLSRWLNAPDQRIHTATVYALAEANTLSARNLLKQVANSDSPLASFARWCVQALDTDAVRSAVRGSGPGRRQTNPQVDVDRSQHDDADAHCTMLWQVCRRTDPSERGELIAALRENVDVWRSRLSSYLRSPDPRDRILVLQIVSTQELARRFQHELRPLLNDTVEGIRELTQRLMNTLSQQPSPHHALPFEPLRRRNAPDQAALEQTRQALTEVLERLSTGLDDPTDNELLKRVRDLLREVYDEEFEREPTHAPAGEGS